MTDYQIQASSRRCTITDREIQPGEAYYSVLVDEGGAFVRRDYSESAWQGPPEGAFSFWKTRMHAGHAPRRPPIDDELLLDCFQRLEGETGGGPHRAEGLHSPFDAKPGRLGFRFVLALLLMRRRRLRLEDSRKENGHEVLILRCTRKGDRYTVVDPQLADDELEAVQEDVFRVLGWE